MAFRDPTMEKGTNSRASSGPSYEAFLSFRGADTRHTFTDFLYHSMIEAGITVFRDSESLHVGKKIGGELLQAIENSKIYIPIFSENYASSGWCLQELAYMVECTSKSNGSKEILPIFLNVEPDDVKLKTNLYRQTLSKRREEMLSTEVESWEKALIEVGTIKGWNWKKDEGQGALIRSVIQTVSVKLKVAYENVTEHLVGVDERVEAIMKKLDVRSNSVQFLGIYGMGVIGKTTLAKVIFNRLLSSFDQCCFLADVRESFQRNGLVHLQKQLLSELLDSHSINEIHQVNDGINMFNRGVLCNKKVLLVLDDVDEKEQLQSLAQKVNWFGSGSRIIITTRNKSVLAVEGEATSEGPANIMIYEVLEMEFDHALKLFSGHAFRGDSPPDNRVSLSEKIIHTLGKLPLGLEIIGSFLKGKPEEVWVDTWRKLQEAPPKDVQKKLMITYERLDHKQKEVFLDIACFFVNKDSTYPFYMWDACGYYPHNAIEVLILMCLIKIKDDNTFWMHDQVRGLGRAIVHEENFKDPYERSRVWNHQEALSILKQKEGSRKIEALSLGNRGVILTHDEVANLRNLRFLEGNGMSLVGDFNNLLSNLRWLSWRSCPHEFVATSFHLTNLVVLNLSHSYVSEKWIGWNQIRVASKLKVLDLSYCRILTRTPDLSTLVSLERLILEGCYNLIEVDPSIGKLKLLTTLNFKGCDSLQALPEEIGCLQALIEIVMPNALHELPRTFGNLPSLLTFDVSHRHITKLPYSIGGLVKLRRLNLFGCMKIERLPDSVGKLQSLVELDLSSTSLDHLPNSIGNLKQLKILRMTRISRITKLPSAIGLIEKLEELDASRCCNLTGIPPEIGELSCLRILDLSYTRISKLPTTVSHLSNLQILKLESYPELKQLPRECPKFGLTSVCGRRRDMEDAVSVVPSFCSESPQEPNGLHLFGVFDGHGCSHVAIQCKKRLHEIVREEIGICKESSVQWKAAMERSFARMDNEVQEWSDVAETSNCRCELQTPHCNAVGSTAVVAIVTPDKIIVSNCGDSRAVLCRNGLAIPLSSDHKPNRPDELERIESAGGRVFYWDGARVLGVLAMSRAIGDNYLKPYVIPDPEVTIVDRMAEDECLILASDGLWDVVSNDTACGVARMCLRARRPPSPVWLPGSDLAVGANAESSDKACSDASILLTKLALARHSTDNVSVVVVDLKRARQQQ